MEVENRLLEDYFSLRCFFPSMLLSRSMSIPKFATVTWSAMGWQKRAAVTVVDLPTYNLVSIIYI